MLVAALFTIAKIWKQPKCPSTDEWIKMWCIFICIYIHTHTHTHNGILLSHKKNEILLLTTTWMGLEAIMLSEISHTEKDKYCMISLMWNLKNKTSEYNKKETDSQI